MNPERIGNQIAKSLLVEQFTEKVSLYPGAFKPPHKGHVATALKAIDDKTDRVIIFMSTKERDGVSVEEAQQVWDLYKQNNPELEKVEIIQTPVPVKAVYDYAKDNPSHDIRAVFGKGEQERFQSLLDKEKYPHVEVFDAGMEGTYSATDLRKAIRDNDLETISEFIPDGINVDDFMSIFQLNEVIVGDKIVCDNCGWEWKIVDGGDDLYICHKCGHDNTPLNEADPKKGTGKKPKGSGRRLYTDEDPSDTVKIKFSTRQDIVDTLNKTTFKNKSHARKSQVINLIHQRVRAALGRTKDPLKKAKLKSAFKYIKQRKEASKKKTQRLKKQKTNEGPQFGILYHFTQDLSQVISSNTLRGPVSLTRSLDSHVSDWLGDQPLLVLDKDKLRTKYKIRPYKDTTQDDDFEDIEQYDEMEEVIDRDITNLDQYLIKVVLPYPDEIWEEYLKEKNISYEYKKSAIKERDRKEIYKHRYLKTKNYLQEARYKKFLNEGWDSSKGKVIGDFVNYVSEYLSINKPKIKLINSPDYTQEYHSFGGYLPSEEKIMVVVHNRNMADILRTVAHEMVHHMQNLDDRLTPTSGEDGSPDENEANSLAAVIMRKFGRENPHIYE